jgi:hypothetical protein
MKHTDIKTYGDRMDISTFSWPRNYLALSSEFQVPAPLVPRKHPGVPTE